MNLQFNHPNGLSEFDEFYDCFESDTSDSEGSDSELIDTRDVRAGYIETDVCPDALRAVDWSRDRDRSLWSIPESDADTDFDFDTTRDAQSLGLLVY